MLEVEESVQRNHHASSRTVMKWLNASQSKRWMREDGQVYHDDLARFKGPMIQSSIRFDY
jgi:hypothetical protein